MSLHLIGPDGKTLKIEMTVDGPNGQQLLKRTFIKK
jgi:GNAT superfamily N-acetyltransferase